MARTEIDIAAHVDDAWISLHRLSTWEGVAGIQDLHDPRHDDVGHLVAFRFAMETAVGRVAGSARVHADKPAMTIRADQKGLEVTLQLLLIELEGSVRARVDARSRATSFLSKPLELTLNALLDSSIHREAELIAGRIARLDADPSSFQ